MLMENASSSNKNPLYVTWESLGEVDAPDPETLAVMRRAAKHMISKGIEDGDIKNSAEAAGVRAEIEDSYQKALAEFDELATEAGCELEDPVLDEIKDFIIPKGDDSIRAAEYRSRLFSADALGRENVKDIIDSFVKDFHEYHDVELRLDEFLADGDDSARKAKNDILEAIHPLERILRTGEPLSIEQLKEATDDQLKNLFEQQVQFERVVSVMSSKDGTSLTTARKEFLNNINPIAQNGIEDIHALRAYALDDEELAQFAEYIDSIPDIIKGIDNNRIANHPESSVRSGLLTMQEGLNLVRHTLSGRDECVHVIESLVGTFSENYQIDDENAMKFFVQFYKDVANLSTESLKSCASDLTDVLERLRSDEALPEEKVFEYASLVLDVYRGADNNTEALDVAENKVKAFENYAGLHSFDDEQMDGLRRLFDRYDAGDPDTKILDLSDNSYGMERGLYGISDFTIGSQIRPIRPRNIQELIQAYREIPTSDQVKFMQNRIDARALDSVIFCSRGFIHDEMPGAHEVLCALLAYYDADEEHRPQFEAEARCTISSNHLTSNVDFDHYGINLQNYECVVAYREDYMYAAGTPEAEEVRDRSYSPIRGHYAAGTLEAEELLRSGSGERAIDILRRLVKNTESDPIVPPECNDAQLNQLMQKIDVLVGPDGVPKVDLAEIGDLIVYVNRKLQTEAGQFSCDASLIRALSYTERLATYAMRRTNEEDRRELFFDPNFKEVVKFRDLTSSFDDFDSQKFERFWADFSNISADADDKEVSEQYGKLSMHIYEQLSKLAARSQREHGNSASNRIMALWSGNLNHELIGLTDSR